MSRKKRTEFRDSMFDTMSVYQLYLQRLTELSISMFDWKNMPDTIDIRYLEMTLFNMGYSIFFHDEALGYLSLRGAIGGKYNVYHIPNQRTAISGNGYNRKLNEKNSVIIYNNYLHTNSMLAVRVYARKLAELDRTIEINANAQKTPVLILCEEEQRLTMSNLYKKYNGNEPVIYGDKKLASNPIKAINTGAPYVCDKLYTLKTQIWNEALTYLGISNTNVTKKERLLVDEIQRNSGSTVASRYSRLESRLQACEQINKMFGLNISCEYRDDLRIIDNSLDDFEEIGGTDSE